MLLELMGSYFGKEIIAESGKSLYCNIANLLSYHLPEVQEILKNIDIANDIKIIRSLVSDVEDKHFNTASFNTALESVNEMLSNINEEIKAIEKEIINHKQKWFCSWRTPNYATNLENLKKMKITLNERLDYFVKITQVLNNLHINNASNNIYNDVTNIDFNNKPDSPIPLIEKKENCELKKTSLSSSYGTFSKLITELKDVRNLEVPVRSLSN